MPRKKWLRKYWNGQLNWQQFNISFGNLENHSQPILSIHQPAWNKNDEAFQSKPLESIVFFLLFISFVQIPDAEKKNI